MLASTDVSIRARQARENMTREKLRELQQENWSLNKAYQAVGQQLDGIKQQMEEQQLKLKRLEAENGKRKEAAKTTHNEGGRHTASGLIFLISYNPLLGQQVFVLLI